MLGPKNPKRLIKFREILSSIFGKYYFFYIENKLAVGTVLELHSFLSHKCAGVMS